MKVQPHSEEQAQASRPGPWPKGEYDFDIISAVEKSSAKGNDMIEVSLNFYGPEGRNKTIKDWIVETAGMAYKTRHFAYSIGLGEMYEAGELNADDCIGRSGKAHLTIEVDRAGKYPDKNVVNDYVSLQSKSVTPTPTTAAKSGTPRHAMATAARPTQTVGDVAAIEDDEIPF